MEPVNQGLLLEYFDKNDLELIETMKILKKLLIVKNKNNIQIW